MLNHVLFLFIGLVYIKIVYIFFPNSMNNFVRTLILADSWYLRTDFEPKECEQGNSECFFIFFPAILSNGYNTSSFTCCWLFHCILVWTLTMMWFWYLNVHCYLKIFGHCGSSNVVDKSLSYLCLTTCA